ncbi:hypothetical protein IB211_00243 [Intestinimonas butyriciproducens]|uniref:Uncharacterized protein n=1 Tax=Intestinimonas butyriciproducens TaxID=1297617 RepID=A0A0S2W072_9FIRM|nr:hypothetical protein IB211_00243 [Intestinimonas butyriciproducens]QBB64426.1 hypothetical protein SRB521_00162 [Intestinimonas butyriciproducens]
MLRDRKFSWTKCSYFVLLEKTFAGFEGDSINLKAYFP